MKKKANESPQIKKYRKKIEDSIIEEKKLINPKAINKMKQSIHLWIAKHADERIDLKNKSIQLFDENRHPAALKSKLAHQLLVKIKTDGLNTKRKFKAKKI